MFFVNSAKSIDCNYVLREPTYIVTYICFREGIRKNNVCSCKPQFYHIEVELGVGLYCIGMLA